MREIKFRAWLKDEGYFVDVKGIDFEREEIYHENIQTDSMTDTEPKSITDPIVSHKFTGIELVQFTGLKDKDRKELYEGDIVKMSSDYMGGTGKVVFHGGEYALEKNDKCFVEFSKSGDTSIGYTVPIYSRLLGSIYEDPKLLDGEL